MLGVFSVPPSTNATTSSSKHIINISQFTPPGTATVTIFTPIVLRGIHLVLTAGTASNLAATAAAAKNATAGGGSAAAAAAGKVPSSPKPLTELIVPSLAFDASFCSMLTLERVKLTVRTLNLSVPGCTALCFDGGAIKVGKGGKGELRLQSGSNLKSESAGSALDGGLRFVASAAAAAAAARPSPGTKFARRRSLGITLNKSHAHHLNIAQHGWVYTSTEMA
jgi:hypothetical protein